ncbi:translation initiation factor [Candidatus Woesearchaeota archaeon]|jgi:translation initiation factor 1|nr:translation initiation factor [Candidatus Woesearchaeota archaeon]
MTDMCETCGLPKDLCVCESIAKESQTIEVQLEKKKFNKNYTVVAGIDQKEIDIKDVASKLKEKLACGGTVKDGKVELQGDHRNRVKDILVELGFAPEMIVVK